MSKPVLWQIPISHYSEKVRWALTYKGVEHERHSPPAGAHMVIAMWLTRGRQMTFPVLGLNGEAIGDSTAIIAALEERWPEPPLYPPDPDARRRALELEEHFDEELGPQTRLLAWHETVHDRETLAAIAADTLPPALRGYAPLRAGGARFASAFVAARYRVKGEAAAVAAREAILRELDRIESELGDGDYLIGDAFTVADLTAAALLYPIVLPAGAPRLPPPPDGLRRFREPLRERRAWRWVEEMFRRHRGGSGRA